jgi:inhibitor of cysteine peptidase
VWSCGGQKTRPALFSRSRRLGNYVMMRMSEADNGREINVAVGETLELELSETSGTGFRWAIRSSGESIVALEKEYSADAATIPGNSRMRCWRFKAIAPGDAKLELVYARPWEKRAPVRSFSVKLRTSRMP